MCLKHVEKKRLGRHTNYISETPLQNSCLITFKKIQKQQLDVFYKKAVVKKVANSLEKHLCLSHFLIQNTAKILNI